jgi:hypothetical protein
MIRGKHWAFSILVLALGCLTICAPSAGAKPKPKPKPTPPTKLLPHRTCQGLLSISDFPGAVSEGPLLGNSGVTPFETNDMTTCEYDPPPVSRENPAPPQGGGSDILTVYGGQFYQHVPHQNLTLFVPKLVDKYVIHGIGTRAYWGSADAKGDVWEGVLQVRNDLFVVVKDSPSGLRRMLTTVAYELSPTGK